MGLRRQPPAYSPLSAAAVLAVLGTGDRRDVIRQRLRRDYGVPEVTLTDSGTSALAAAIAVAADARDRLPCALPAYGCFDLVSAALAAGARIRFYDVDPASLLPDEVSLREALAEGVSSVVVVHHHGTPVPLEEVHREVARAGALLIDDAAQGVGARVGSRRVGSLGDLGVLSFSRGKGTTGGGGGALVVADAALAPAVAGALAEATEGGGVATGARLLLQWMFANPVVYAIPASLPFLRIGETIYREPRPPRRMAKAHARVLDVTLGLAEAESEARRANADRIASALAVPARGRLIATAAGTTPGWLRLPVLGRRDDAAARRGLRLGCVPGYPIALPALPVLAGHDIVARTPGATELAERLWTVPVHSRLTSADLRGIASWIDRLGS